MTQTQEKLTKRADQFSEFQREEYKKLPVWARLLISNLTYEIDRHRAAAGPKEDMLDKASTWLAAYHAYTTGNRQYAVEALAMEFESISTEATRKERERAAKLK